MASKLQNRLVLVGLNTAWTLLPSLANLGAAWWVVARSSEAVWGAFVDPLLFAAIAVHVLSWGNKEFLLRAFALRPDATGILFRQALVSRGMLLFIVLPALFLTGWPLNQVSLLMAWILAGFVRQSFEVVVVARKAFGRGLWIELGTVALLGLGLWMYRDDMNLYHVLQVFAGSQVARALAYVAIWGKPYLSGSYPQIQFRYFNTALPFFLLGFVGMLVTRTDLICVSLWLDDAAVGRYQVMINLLVYLQAGAGFLLYPYVRNIYRLPDRSILKLARRMLLPGLGATLLGVPAAFAFLWWGFDIHMGWDFAILAGVYVLPVYFYTSYVYLLFKHHKQQQVVLANAGAALLNLGLNLILIPVWGLWGALLATCAAQLFTLTMLLVYAGRRLR